MPELPEIEVIRRTIDARLVGRRLEDVDLKRTGKTSMQGADGLGDLPGNRLTEAGRRGKMLVLGFEHSLSLVIHLMLIGRVALTRDPTALSEHARLRLRFEGGDHLEVRFVAARDLALLPSEEVPRHRSIARQGPDALSITLPQFRDALGKVRGPVKRVFMEQDLIAGVGNAYADEILFEAGLYPLAPADSLDDEAIARLHGVIAPVLQRSIDLGAAGEYVQEGAGEGELSAKKEVMRVHNRMKQPCPSCGTRVEMRLLSGRGTFFCPHCQPRPA